MVPAAAAAARAARAGAGRAAGGADRSRRRSWPTTPSSAHDARRPGERLPYLLRALKAPRDPRAAAGDGRAGPRRGLALRAVPGGALRGRGVRARGLRRPPTHPRRRLPRPQDAGGLRLRRPARRRTPAHPAPRAARLDRRSRQRLLPRPARHRQDATSPPRWRSRPARPGTARCSRPPSNGSTASKHAQHRNSLDDELAAWTATGCWSIDEIGYLPLERQAANLLFALIARRYERGSIIVTSNRGFEAWGEILGDAMVAAALIDRLVHHATMITLKGKSYRLRERAAAALRKPRQRARPTELS